MAVLEPLGIPDTISGWAATIGFVITGAFALYSIFDKTLRSRRQDADGTDDRLINLLKDEVDVLQRKVEEYGKDMQAMKILMAELKQENQSFRAVFQQRDPDSIAIREESRQAMKVVYAIQKDVQQLYGALNRHLERLEKAETGPKKETIVKTTEPI